jgi:hypothetical protein
MDLFIRIQNGQPFEHPIMGDNFKQAFSHIDTDNLPSEFAKFVRVAPPEVGPFEILTLNYGLVNGIWSDVYTITPMTEEEKAAKIATVRENLPEGWGLDEETLQVSLPPKPDGGEWRFDLEQNVWVEVAPNE